MIIRTIDDPGNVGIDRDAITGRAGDIDDPVRTICILHGYDVSGAYIGEVQGINISVDLITDAGWVAHARVKAALRYSSAGGRGNALAGYQRITGGVEDAQIYCIPGACRGAAKKYSYGKGIVGGPGTGADAIVFVLNISAFYVLGQSHIRAAKDDEQ